MKSDLLLTHFDRISDAPEAIPRLRRFILDLAVRGKLVEQNPNGASSVELLTMNDQARRAIAESDRRAEASRQVLLAEESKWSIPSSWSWSALADLVLFIDYRGKTPTKTEKGVRLVTAKNVKKGFINASPEEFLSDREYRTWMTRGLPKEGDILFTTEAPMGNAAVVRSRERFALAQRVICFRPYGAVTADFMTFYLLSEPFQSILIKTATGLTAKGIKAAKLARLPVAVPPLPEQDRIVMRVNELMALCDRLEAARSRQETRRDQLTVASLHRLSNGVNSPGFRENARFYINYFPTFTTKLAHVRQLRQTIFELAARGKLIEQDPKDQPVSELLKCIEAKRAMLSKEGEIKLRMTPAPIREDMVPFQLPVDWRWVRFGELIEDSDAGWSPKSESFPRSGNNWGVLKVSAVSWDRFLAEENKQLLAGVIPPPNTQVNAGDFLISRANTSELVAKSVIVEEKPQNLILSDKIVRLRITQSCDKKFLSMINNHAAYARSYYAEEASGTSFSMKNVSRNVIYMLPVPLPPLAEQHRIVAKVDELMRLCDRLEEQLIAADTKSRGLLEAVLHQALNDSRDTIGERSAVHA
jgi:type I restriction enzyme S subunit